MLTSTTGEIDELKKDIEIVRLKQQVARQERIAELQREMDIIEREREKMDGWWVSGSEEEKNDKNQKVKERKKEVGGKIEKAEGLAVEKKEAEHTEIVPFATEPPELSGAELIEVRRKEEKELNEEIQQVLVGLNPSIVELLLIRESELPKHDRIKLNAEFKRENSGVVGIGFEDENGRVVYVHTSLVSEGTADFKSASEDNTLSSNKQMRILVGSDAFQAHKEDAATTLSGKWYYRADDNEPQGPYKTRQMREWNSKGFFEPSVLVRKSDWHEDQMQTLESLWPDLTTAFSISPQSSPQSLPQSLSALSPGPPGSSPSSQASSLKGEHKFLNIKMFEKLQSILQHDHTFESVEKDLDRMGGGRKIYNDLKRRLEETQIYGWENVNWDNGVTLLHWACKQGNLDLVKFLISECGALPTEEDGDGFKPMDYATNPAKNVNAASVVNWFMGELGKIVNVDDDANVVAAYGKSISPKTRWTDWGSGLEDFLLVGDKDFGMTESDGHFLSRGGIDPKDLHGQGHLATDVDLALIELRQQQEVQMNGYIQKRLVGLCPSLVELLLIDERVALSAVDQQTVREEYKREKAGIFGVSRRETYRMIFVWVGSQSAPVSAKLSEFDMKTSILVGSEAIRAASATKPAKILNMKLFDKLMVMLNHGHESHDVVHDIIEDETDQAPLTAAKQQGWINVNWDRGFTLLHGAARNGDLNLCKYFIAECGADPFEPDRTQDESTPKELSQEMKNNPVFAFYHNQLEYFQDGIVREEQDHCLLEDLLIVTSTHFATALEQGSAELVAGRPEVRRSRQSERMWTESASKDTGMVLKTEEDSKFRL